MAASEALRLAADIGGAFTDVAAADGDGRILATAKTPTTAAPAEGALAGLRRALADLGRGFAEITGFVHGATLATNALIERRGARVATVTTEGFRDILEIAYERRYSQYDLDIDKPDLIVPRARCFTVPERIDATGRVRDPLDETALDRLLAEIDASGAEALAICLLHSYANPAHERRLRDVIAAARPHLAIALSSEISPEAREFERLCTTVANACVQPLMANCLHAFEAAFRAEGLRCPILMMTSGGGMTTLETAARAPIRLVESGPAGGAVLAAQTAAAAALDRAVGAPLALSSREAALGVSQIVDESMASAGRMHAVESGKDLGDRTMIAFGGNGPLHATRVARRAGVSRILIPRDPGVGSAVGLLHAPVSYEIVRSRYATLDAFDADAIEALFAEMTAEATAVVRAGAPDDRTVVFTLQAGDADFPFSIGDYHLIIAPANPDGTADWRSGIGAGPYAIEVFEPGVRARYVRHENYFKSDRAWFDAIEMRAVIDPTARTNALMTGEVDAIDRAPTAVAGRVGAHPNVVLQEVAGTQHYTFAMNTTADPYADNHIRQALKYAIDREALVQKILFGYGVVGNDHRIGRGQRFFNSELAQKTVDPDQARRHLRQAGMDSLTVELSVADAAFQGAVDAGQLYAETARAAGIDLTVIREPNDGYWSDVWLKKPFCAVYWSARPTEDAMFSTAYAEGARWNDTYWSNARFNELLVAARAELDEAMRRAMYYEMQDICANDGGTIVPMFASYVFAHSPAVAHDALASNWDMDGEKWAERWWFV